MKQEKQHNFSLNHKGSEEGVLKLYLHQGSYRIHQNSLLDFLDCRTLRLLGEFIIF